MCFLPDLLDRQSGLLATASLFEQDRVPRADLVVGNLDKLSLLIRQGGFDRLLIRPLSSLHQVLTGEVGIRRVGTVAQSAAVLAISLAHLDVHWTAGRLLIFASSFVTGLPDFRIGLGDRDDARLLDGRLQRGRQRVHLRRRQLPGERVHPLAP